MRKPKLFITGSCSPHLGNWEQQLGNAAILIGLLQSIHEHIPGAVITTKYQLSDDFQKTYGIKSAKNPNVWGTRPQHYLQSALNLPISLLWRLFHRLFRMDIKIMRKGGLLREYFESDVIIDVSGDTYGDNVRFRTFIRHSFDLLTARILGKPVISLANSPGPFSGKLKLFIAKLVLNNLCLITTREPESAALLRGIGVRTPIVITACPAYLLKPAPGDRIKEIMSIEHIDEDRRPLIGVTLCGYNLYSRPTWGVPETFEDLKLYIPTFKYLLEELKASVLLIPHVYRTNPWTGQRIQGPDYLILKTLAQMVDSDKYAARLKLIEGAYSPSEVKGLIGKLDLHLSGRLHAGVAALSQYVPTVLMAYGHKHYGFARLLGQERYVWRGKDATQLLSLVKLAWENKNKITKELRQRVPSVKALAELNVKIIADLINLKEEERVQFPERIIKKWIEMGWEEASKSND